jgi:hypothetical protein
LNACFITWSPLSERDKAMYSWSHNVEKRHKPATITKLLTDVTESSTMCLKSFGTCAPNEDHCKIYAKKKQQVGNAVAAKWEWCFSGWSYEWNSPKDTFACFERSKCLSQRFARGQGVNRSELLAMDK